MKLKTLSIGLVTLGLSALTSEACKPTLSGVVSCPNGQTAAGIKLWVADAGMAVTSANGAFFINLDEGQEGTYTVCIVESSLPPGFSVAGPVCKRFSVSEEDWFADVNFELKGPSCETPPPPGPCWLTGGGTIGKTKGVPAYSYGGVVNPGCSPTAAGGGNWNIVNHADKLHFKGLDIAVVDCSGVPTKSPKVDVNIIDFMGTGTIVGINGNPMPETFVSFIARAVDANEPGSGVDKLYIRVIDPLTQQTLLLISADPQDPDQVAPVEISTGNLQIHTSSCE